ncbi:Fructosamine-3-kinase [Giardia muris]|uniref:protein-ribulosamine 3-kinase n=1 Tax=Giardia muris TaxID=5742 RepID=A0A4Z1SWC6_GIAMU|nr:Fructosamine-3-kinase [Giardia muris]|eukprot:TNJ30074.1 Fructosamine-3-kinase [Giardia muris]
MDHDTPEKRLAKILHAHGLTLNEVKACGGGCISGGYIVTTTEGEYFIKTNSSSFLRNFEAEKASLEALASVGAMVCPSPLYCGVLDDDAYLLMTVLPHLSSACGKGEFGAKLAEFHIRGERSERIFGFPTQTFCGATPLDNTETDDPWPRWFAKHRIGDILQQIEKGTDKFLLERILPNGVCIADIEKAVEALLNIYAPDVRPSLLHGDLWGGNAGISNRRPCFFDPGCYYGDAEVDVATTQLFGGFPSNLLTEYSKVRKLSPNYEEKEALYNLYHILNHALMFGGGYCSEARAMIKKILEKARMQHK